jgi:hypothetical protein
MKIKDVRILSEISVTSTNYLAECDNYIAETMSLCGGVYALSKWFQYHTDLPNYAWMFPGKDEINFSCSIVDYTTIGYHPVGITRRDALRILKRIGLKSPTLSQVIAVANHLINNDDVFDPCYITAGSKHPVVCPVSFNPEYPDFYYFGHKGKSQFDLIKRYGRQKYTRIHNDKGLYFGDLNLHDSGYALNFPFLLGIKS